MTGRRPARWLLVTDLDGTLWDGGNRLHPGAREAVERLVATGALVLAATARRPASTLRAMTANRMLLPAVLFDGSLGRDLTTGETFHVNAFGAGEATRVLDLLAGCGLEPCVNVVHPERDVLVGAAPSTNPHHLDFVAEWTRRADLRAALEREAVLSFTIVGRDQRALEPALEAVRSVADASLMEDVRYGGASLSVRPRGVSKWSGVLAFCAARGVDPVRTVAVGDGENDVEMLSQAAVSCTFAGASPGAIASAGHVLPAAGEGGWAEVVERAADIAALGA